MNKSNKEISKLWDSRIIEIEWLIKEQGYRLKNIADHYKTSVNIVSSHLHRRGMSLLRMRHESGNVKVIRGRTKVELREEVEKLEAKNAALVKENKKLRDMIRVAA